MGTDIKVPVAPENSRMSFCQLHPKETEPGFLGIPHTDEAMGTMHGVCVSTDHLQIVIWNFLPTGRITLTIFAVLDSLIYR